MSRADDRWRIEAWANNLTDQDFGIVASRPALHTDGLNLVRGLPRTLGLTLQYTF